MTHAEFKTLSDGLNTLGRHNQTLLDTQLRLEQKMDKIIAALADLKTTITTVVTDAGNVQVVDPAKEAAALQAIADIKAAVGALDTKFKGG